MLALEARILLDAAANETAAEVTELAVHSNFADDFVATSFSDDFVDEPNNPLDQPGFTYQRVPTIQPTEQQITQRSEIAFIAAGVSDLESIIASLSHETEVVMLDGSDDGVTQIAQVLSSRSETDAIHLIGHGREGVLALGGQELSSESMTGYYAGQLATIRDAMTDAGDILIYGCNFAGGESGRDAVLALARITGADVAASTDLTGDSTRGGDWTLETVLGELDTGVIEVQNWAGLLAAPLVADDSYLVEPLVPVIVDPRANDSDPEGTSLTITEITDSITRTPVAIGVASPVVLTSGTMIALNADGTLTVTSPSDGQSTETFGYTVQDMNGETSVATITLQLDTDGDGVVDSTDIDDDNDGILDIVENKAGTGSLIPIGPNLYQGFDNGTFGFESGAPDQYTTADPYPGGVTNGTFDHFSDIDYGDFTYVANAVTPRNAFQHVNAVDPVYGAAGRFFLSDPDASAPIVSDVIGGMVAGETYQYSFWAANSEPFGNPNNIEVRIDGAVAFTTGPLSTDPVAVPWTKYSFTFVAPSSGQVSTALVALETGPGGNDYYLDNIEVRRMGRDGDGDGVANSQDLDSDNDGITDNVEAQSTASYIRPAEADVDGDGLDDAYDLDNASADPVLSSGLTPIDTDSDLVSDVLDNDSDADGIGDVAERDDGQPTSVTTTADTDGDGLLDIFEHGSSADGYDVNDQNLDSSSTIFNLAGVPALDADGANAVPFSTDLLFRDTSDAPTAVHDTNSTGEDGTLTVPAVAGLLANDTDLDGDTLVVSDFTVGATTVAAGATINLAEGDLTINADGSYTFDPAADFNGPVPVATYTVSDSNGGSDTATLTIAVTPVNDAPVAVDDTDSTAEDTTLTVPAAAGLMRGDSDPEGDALTITGFTVSGSPYAPGATANLVEGDLTINADGSYTFVPAADYNGPVPVATYTVSDGNGGTDTATLTIAVTPANDAPVAVDDADSAAEDTTLTVPAASGLLTNDTDLDGDTLVVSDFTVGATTVAAGATINLAEGDLTINADGSYVFDPAADFNGPVPVATYTVSDGNGGSDTATLTLAIIPVNDAPATVDDTDSTAEDTTLTVPAAAGLMRGDSDPEGDALTITGFTVSGSPFAPGATANLVEGDLTINADGSYTFVPAVDFNGSVPVATYTVSDGNGGADTATLTLTVTPVNDNPVAAGNTDSIAEDVALTVPTTAGLLTNDSDLDGDTLVVSDFTVGATTVAAGATINLAEGDLTINADGSYVFDPAADFNGPVPVATYTVSDGNGGSDTATLTIAVTPVNDAPVAVDDTDSTAEDTTLTVPAAAGLMRGDSDPEGDALTITGFTVSGSPFAPGATANLAEGDLTINADGSYTFVPAADFYGPAPVATYTVSDGNGGIDTATLTIAVTPFNDAPVATDNIYLSNEDTTVGGNIIADDTGAGFDMDADMDTLFISAATVDLDGNGTLNALPLGTPTPIGDPSGDMIGLIELAADGTFSFEPTSGYHGPVPVVGYTVSDGNGGTHTATLTIALVPVNDAPISASDAVNVPEDGATPLKPTLPTDVDDLDSTLVITVTQVPDPDRQGAIYFVPDGGSTAQLVSVGTLLTPPELSATSFMPVTNYAGPVDSFLYQVEDDDGASDAGSLGTVAITIISANDTPENTVPVTGDIPVAATTTDEDSALVFGVANGNAISVGDADGDSLTTTITAASGTLTVAGGSSATVTNDSTASVRLEGSAAQINAALEGLTYMPPADYNGPLGGASALTIVTFDGVLTDLDNIAIGINPVDDITDDAVAINEDVAITFNLVAGTNGATADSFEGAPVVTSVTQAANGSIAAGAGGLVTYTPDSDFNGSDTFTYTVTSGGVTETATVTVTVIPVNDAPVATDDVGGTTENTPLAAPAEAGLLQNDTDVDEDTLTITEFSVGGSSFVSGATAALIEGDLTINADGSYTFIPAPDFNGSGLVSNYAITDGNGGTSTATLTIAVTPAVDGRIAPPLTTTPPVETISTKPARATPSVSTPGIIVETVRKIDSLNSTLVLDSQVGPITMALESMGGLNPIDRL